MRSLRSGVFLAMSMWLSASGAGAQDVKIPMNIEKLSAKARETVNVTVDGPLLQLAGKFLSSNDADEVQVKKLVESLKGIYVRSFEFDKDGEYSKAELESLRSQLRAPAWTQIIGVRGKEEGEDVDVFVKQEKGQIAGLVVIAAEPKELTLVNIVGRIDLEQLAKLGRQFGIPKIDMKKAVPAEKEPQKKPQS